MGFEPQRRGASSFKARRFNLSATEDPQYDIKQINYFDPFVSQLVLDLVNVFEQNAKDEENCCNQNHIIKTSLVVTGMIEEDYLITHVSTAFYGAAGARTHDLYHDCEAYARTTGPPQL